MEPSAALRRGPRVVLDYPSSVLAFYLFAASVAVVARVPLLAALAVAVASLASQGRLDPVVDALREFDPQNPTATSGLESAVQGLVTPTVVAALVVGFLLAFVAFVLMRAATAAATLAAVYAALGGETVRTAGVAGVGRYWRSFLGLAVLRFAALAMAAVPAVGGAALAAGATFPGHVLVAGLLALASVGLVPAVFLSLAFAGQAVVVDGAGAWPAVRRSAGFPVGRPGAFLVYVVVALATFVGFGGVAFALAGVGAPQAAGVLSALVVLPAFDGFKTALYADEVGAAAPVRPDLRTRVAGGLRRGVRRLGGFVRGHPWANAASVACLLVGAGAGWLLTAPYGTVLDPMGGEVPSFGTGAPAVFVNLAANNWLVAAGTGYGGAVLGVPAASNLLFNGVVIGGVAGVADPVAFVALVAPHGVLELPAIAVAGGLGFHLAGVTWRGYRGELPAAAVGDAFVEAFEVLVGLAVVFVVAAFVEAFLTPAVAAAVLS